MKASTLLITALFIFTANITFAQTTEITYQGQLQSSSAPANGNFDFEFLLFDALTGGTQIGSTLTRNGVAVANGIFAVNLDFGGNFPGANRFLEIHVRQSGGGAFTPLTPRQAVSSTPYAIKSLNADTATTAVNATNATTATNANQLGGVAASGYLQTNGNGSALTNLNASNITTGTLSNERLGQIPTANIADSAVTSPKIATGQVVKSLNGLTDTVTLAGSGNIAVTQTANTLTIASTGGGGCPSPCTAAIFNATQQYNLGGSRLLSAPGSDNLFVGVGAAATGPTGVDNTFVGSNAGQLSTRGDANSFFGVAAGVNNTGTANSFFGRSAGFQNRAGSNNSFFGVQAGRDNCGSSCAGAFDGSNNSFFGRSAGQLNAVGYSNSFFGKDAGFNNFTGSVNTFVGDRAGFNNRSGSGNTFFGGDSGITNVSGSTITLIGDGTDVGLDGLSNATAIGVSARVAASDTMVLGSSNGTGTNVVIGANGGNISFLNSRAARLNVFGGAPWTSNGWKSAIQIEPAGAIGWDGNGASFGIGTSTGGLYFFHTSAPPGVASLPASYDLVIADTGRVGIGTTIPNQTLEVNGRARITSIPMGPSPIPMCFNAPGDLINCNGSSLRFKKNVQRYSDGLNILRKLSPISYNWKEGGAYDIGLGAEDVAKAAPFFAVRNKEGVVEGVRYERLNMVLINAVQEQQKQIEKLVKQVGQQRQQIRGLTRTVRAINSGAGGRRRR